MKKHSSKYYLFAGFFSLALCVFCALLAMPLFIKWLIPFPKLEETVVYEGTLHIEGTSHTSKFGEAAPSYYIEGKDGRHKIFWGILGDEEDYFLGKDSMFEEVSGKVWYHQVFGVIQEEFTATAPLMKNSDVFKNRPVFGQRYLTGPKQSFEKHFNYDKYYWRLLPSLVGLAFFIYNFIRYKKSRN